MSPEQQALANAAQLASPSYRLAALDQDFLLGESMGWKGMAGSLLIIAGVVLINT